MIFKIIYKNKKKKFEISLLSYLCVKDTPHTHTHIFLRAHNAHFLLPYIIRDEDDGP